jgi:hypothetical protein
LHRGLPACRNLGCGFFFFGSKALILPRESLHDAYGKLASETGTSEDEDRIAADAGRGGPQHATRRRAPAGAGAEGERKTAQGIAPLIVATGTREWTVQ